MREAIDYNALSWVRHELTDTLKQARQHLEDYAGNGGRESLQGCVAYLHEARGPLQMINLKGADLLTGEMEETLADLLLDAIGQPDTALELLMQAFLALPEYLYTLRSGRTDDPAVLFPVINALRAIRGLPPLQKDAVFAPNLSVRVPTSVFDVRAEHPEQDDMQAFARAARIRFQSGLLDWYRNGDNGPGLGMLVEVLDHLLQNASSEPAARLWWVSGGVAELLRDGGLTITPENKRLFGQVDRLIKRLMDQGESVFSDVLTDDLLRNLLFHLAEAEAMSPRAREICATYGVEAAADRSSAGDDGGVAPIACSEELLQTVSATVREDIERIKDQLDEYLQNGQTDSDVLPEVADALHALGNMLGMIGMDSLGEDAAEGEQLLRKCADGQHPVSDEDSTSIANTLVAIEDRLSDILSSIDNPQGDDNHDDATFRQGQNAVIQAVMDDLVEAKESINGFLQSSRNHELLADVPAVLNRIHGGLQLAGQERIANATGMVGTFVSRELVEENRQLSDEDLDTLADAICSIEYCVEELLENREFGDRAIEIAEQSVAKLGYACPLIEEAEVEKETEAKTEDDSSESVAVEMQTEVFQPETEAVAPGPQPAETPVTEREDDITAMQNIDEQGDPEIIEIFIEEASEELEKITALIPEWCDDPVNQDTLTEIRRSFHTMKGSGRMVGAMATGEFSWSMENLANRLLDGTVDVGAQVLDLLRQAPAALSALLEKVQDPAVSLPHNINELARQAQACSKPGMKPEEPDAAAPVTVAEIQMQSTEPSPAGDVPVAPVDDSEQTQPADEPMPQVDLNDYPVLEDGADPEIVEIFMEEATEEFRAISISIPAWVAKPEDRDLVTELQRNFHTLKGSGRMAGAMRIGEFCWAVELLFNRLSEGAIQQSASLFKFMVAVPEAIAQMLAQIGDDAPETGVDCQQMMDQAMALASGMQPSVETQDAVADIAEEETVFGETDTGQQLFDAEIAEDETACSETDADQQLADDEEAVLDEVDEEIAERIDDHGGDEVDVAEIEVSVDELIEASAAELDDDYAPSVQTESDDLMADDRMPEEAEPAPADENWLADGETTDSLPGPAVINTEDFQHGAEPPVVDETVTELSADSDPVVEADAVAFDEAEESAVPARETVEPEIVTASPEAGAPPVVDVAQPDPYESMDQELYEIFVEEATEIMDASEAALRSWSDEQDNRELMAEFQRHLHTLKGSARMIDLEAIGNLSHAMESVMTEVADDRVQCSPELLGMLADAHDRLAEMLEQVRNRQVTVPASDLEATLQTIAGVGDVPVSNQVDRAPDNETAGPGPESAVAAVEQPQEEEPPAPVRPEGQVVAPPRLVVNRDKQAHGRGEQVKVQSDVLDNMVNHAGEINIYRARMEKQISDYRFNLSELDSTISRLREQLRKLEMETEAQILYRYEQESDQRHEDFDPLEMDRYSNLQQLSRSLIESISDLRSLQELMENTTRDSETLLLQQSRVSIELQENLIRTRMIPFVSLSPRLRRIARQSARQLDKRVEVHLIGEDGEMDRAVVERIIAPLEHMLRNSVAHGIEAPGARKAAGKAVAGTINIGFEREGSEIVLRIADDGAGMDIDAIRERAIERGLMAADSDLPDEDVIQFVLQTGFSTASEVTQLSGRGVGMDVVNSEVKQLGGSLHIESIAGEGVTFTVRLPYTLAINQGMLITAGDETFCIPLASVEGVVRFYPEEIRDCFADDRQQFEYGGNEYRLKHLASLLDAGNMVLPPDNEQVPVLLVRAGEKRIGFQVEGLQGIREVVIKPVGPQLSTIDGISGATILGDGRVVMILDMVAISRREAAMQDGQDVVRPALPSDDLVVMVVDDSITVRKVTTRLLERNGYKVITAKDGVDAMGKLQELIPDIMLLDIEMPRMDGFELATHMRNDNVLKHVPIIMITSRTGDKHRERARQIGVQRYLGKPYQESDLLVSIHDIIGVSQVAAGG